METPSLSNDLLPGEGKAPELNKVTRWEREDYFPEEAPHAEREDYFPEEAPHAEREDYFPERSKRRRRV
jgi:hypothetical protein